MPFEFFPNTNFHDMNLDYILEKTQKIDDNMRDSQASADAAKASEEAAKASEDAAKLSEENAKASEEAAKDYAENIADPVSGLVTGWLNEHITQETGYVLDRGLSSSAAAAPADLVGSLTSAYFPVSDYTAENPFTIADMPANSHTYTYAYKCSDAPAECAANDLILIRVSSSTADGKVRLLQAYNNTTGQAYSGRYNSGYVQWFTPAAKNKQSSILNDNTLDLMDPAIGAANLSTGSRSGVTYTWNPVARNWNIYGTSTALSFYNFLDWSNALPMSVKPGSYLTVEATGLTRGVAYVHVYLYPNSMTARQYRIYAGRSLLYIPEECTGLLMRFEVDSGITVDTTVTLRVYTDLTKSVRGSVAEQESIKMLVYGSSFSYSTLGLLPQLFKEICPNTRFVLGLCYRSGATLQQHAEMWTANTAYPTYSEYDSQFGYWNNLTSSISGKAALARHKWDFVTLQQASRYARGDANYNALATFADMILEEANFPFSFLYNIPQSLNAGAEFPASYTGTGREKSDAMFNDMAAYAQHAADDKYISAVIPGGTAVQNARTTSLDQIGDAGDLAFDNNGHLQNGIATLIPAYAALYTICKVAGIKPKAYCSQYNPTDADLENILLYTRTSHGTCEGVTDENKIIAQKCALMAIKNPYEITDMGV